MITLSIIGYFCGSSILVGLAAVFLVLVFTNGNITDKDAWVKAFIIIIAFGILIISIYQVTFLEHPEDYGYTKIIEEITDDC